MGKLDGIVALVTGGARGLGKEIALLFGREGADVGILDLNKELAESVAGEIRGMGRRSVAVIADVSNWDQVQSAVNEVTNSLGPIGVLVNNAGIDTTSTVVDMPVEMWDQMMEVNLRSVFLCTKAVLPTMIEKRFGRIINISSQLAYKGAATMAHYSAAKAGVLGFTRSLAYEVSQYNINVNAIAPGPLDTELFRALPEDWRKRKLAEIPLGRAGDVSEIAPTALLLASADGSYYQGATLNPNGGDIMI